MLYAYGRKKLLEFFVERSFPSCKSGVFLSTACVNGAGEFSSSPEFLLRKHRFNPETVSKVASAVPCLRNAHASDSVLVFMKDIGFSSSQVQKVVAGRPEVLTSSLERTIKPKIKIFQDLGYSDDVVAEVISKYPLILRRGVKEISQSLYILKDLLKSDGEVARLLKRSGWYLVLDLRKTLMPNIQLLVESGVNMNQIIKCLFHYPRFLLSDPQVVKKGVSKADQMGASRSGRMFIHSVRAATAMSDSTWEMKLQTFRDIGFTEGDISKAFRGAPNVFVLSAEKMVKVAEFVLATGKYGIPCIISNPTALCYSIEKSYRPRVHVLETLESKDLISHWPRLGALVRSSNQIFYNKYVLPYASELGDACSFVVEAKGSTK